MYIITNSTYFIQLILTDAILWFCILTLCLLECDTISADGYQHFGGTICFHLQWIAGEPCRWSQQVPLTRWLQYTRLHGVTSQMTVILILTSRTSNIILSKIYIPKYHKYLRVTYCAGWKITKIRGGVR